VWSLLFICIIWTLLSVTHQLWNGGCCCCRSVHSTDWSRSSDQNNSEICIYKVFGPLMLCAWKGTCTKGPTTHFPYIISSVTKQSSTFSVQSLIPVRRLPFPFTQTWPIDTRGSYAAEIKCLTVTAESSSQVWENENFELNESSYFSCRIY